MQPVRSANDTAEFRRNYTATEFTNALYALDAGHRGQGVTVGVIDDGAVNVNGELDGRISDESKDFGRIFRAGVGTARNVLGDANSKHGTPVTNILAAADDGRGTMGFAPRAQVAILRIDDFNADTGVSTMRSAYDAVEYAGQQGIKLVNLSATGGADAGWSRVLMEFGRNGSLLIQSAGNGGNRGQDTASPVDAPFVNAEARKSVLFVGSLAPDMTRYQIESYSNRAGTMADRYVVAPGTNATVRVDGSIGLFSGTSSAAPVVSGLAATILSKWPQLTGQQAGDIILNTARDIGDPGPDPIFGRGLVDFKAALSPVNPTLSNGMVRASLDTSVMGMPEAMGSAAVRAALGNVTVLDDYGRDYAGSVAGLVVQPQAGRAHMVARRVQQLAASGSRRVSVGAVSGSFGFAAERFGAGQEEVAATPLAGSIGFTLSGTNIHAGWNAADSLQHDAMGLAPLSNAVLAYAPQAGTSVGFSRRLGEDSLGIVLSVGEIADVAAQAVTMTWSHRASELRLTHLNEEGAVMGMPVGSGALRLGTGARTLIAEGRHGIAITRGWSLSGYASVGLTRLDIDPGSIVTGATSIVGTRFGLQAEGSMLGGLATFGVAQPLTIESGEAVLTLARGYDLSARSLTHDRVVAPLTGVRRVQLIAGYTVSAPSSSARFGVAQDLSGLGTTALAALSHRF